MLRFFFFFFFFFSSILSTFANTGDEDSLEVWTPVIEKCETLYTLAGPEAVKVETSHEYNILSLSGTDFSGTIIYTLKRDKETIESITGRQKYLRYFTTPGLVTLEAKLSSEDTLLCSGVITRDIRVYQKSLVYIGKSRAGIESGMREVFEQKDILYRGYETTADIFSQIDEGKTAWLILDQSDIFVVGTDDILGSFSDILKSQKAKPISFTKKKIYILSNYSRSFLSKVLASTLSQLGATRVSLISEDQFYSLITRVSTGEDAPTLGEELSYEKSKTIYSLGGFLEFLAYAGFSYQLLAFLLSITLVVLILNILKQVIGFHVFGIYYPILTAITIVALGFQWALIFIGIGFISILVVNLFTRKVHLLLHAKRALLISVYILLFLIVLGVDNYFELTLIRYALFDNPLIIFPFFVTIVLADKVFQDDIDIFSHTGIYDLFQYSTITAIIYLLFEYKTLQYFLISYPDVIILIVILNIIVWRYMWLQMFEYFRFSPLLRKIDEEEE